MGIDPAKFLSERAKGMKGSEIRRLFKISMRPGVISFAGGLPDPGSFPSGKVAEVLGPLLRSKGEILLQYGPARGDGELVELIAERMARKGMDVSPGDILITSGAQQALDISGKLFINPGDVVIVENPSFIGALGAFRNYQARLVGTDMDEHGMVVEKLDELLQDLKDDGAPVKFIYTIPNFHNPTGITMSRERREKLIELCERYDLILIEDDAYGDLWFEGDPGMYRPIKSMDGDGRVIYAGSFSKIISPGIRLGWVAASKEIADRFEMAKQMMDVCPSPLIQAIATELLKGGYLEGHIARLRDIYRSRRDAMLSALERHMPEGIGWTRPRGGFYIWVTLPEGMDALELFDKALDNGVAYVIGSAFYADESGRNTFRISYCHETEDVIEEGIARLGRAVKEMMGG